MSADGSGQSPLTAGTGPAWSADGRRVAFSRAGNLNLNEDIYVVNADGSGQTQLTRNRPDVYLRDSSPTWSPDGTKIAFVSTRDKEAGYTEVYVMSADGSAQTRLTYTPGLGGSAHSPAWSPDGTRIAFASNQHGASQEVYLMDPDGSAQTRLTYTPSGHSGRPAWSPDGRKIAFNSTRDGNAEIYVMNADGSGQARLTHDPEREIKPAWSPDGRKIAFTSSRDTPNHRDQIWVMNADGSGQTNISNSGANDWLPDWQALDPPPPPPPLPPPPPRPDFAISPAASAPIVLTPGGSARVTLTLRRFNGSTGPISFAAHALPAGVSASFAPNPAVGGDGEHVTLTLSARAEARAVTNTRVSVSGVAQRDSAGTAPRAVTFLLTVAGRVDLRARGIDVIQASQTGGILIPSGLSQRGEYRGVELAAGAKTIARVYTDATGAGRTGVPVAVALSGYDSATGRPLPGSPIFPFEGPSRVSERALPLVLPEERVDPDGVHTFVLPPAWTRGKITLAAQVSPPERRFVDENPVLECEELGCSHNNRFSLTEVEFTRTRSFTIAPIAITREGGRAIPGPASAFYATRAVIPIGEQQLTIPDSYRTTIDNSAIANATTPPNPNSDPNDDARELEAWKGGATKALVEAWDARNAKLGDVTIGINDGAVRGRASGRSAIARFDQGRGAPSGNQRPLTSVAHETFHLLGRPYASGECGGKDGGSFEDWPPDGRGRLQGIGLDRRRSYNPGPFRVFEDRGSSVYYDFMSYCASVGGGDPDAWVSPRNWEAVLRRRREFGTVVGPDAGPARVANAAAASVSQLAVRGYASPSGSAITSVEPTAPGRTPEARASGFRLVARNAAGAVVGEAPVAATPDAEGDLTMLDGAVRAPGAAKVEIVRDGAVVAERQRSPHQPRVRVLSPRRGARVGGHPRVVVRWSAQDADRAPLLASVDYSADGGRRWRTLFVGPSRGRVSLAARLLSGSRRARVRVRVNDGFNETVSTSPRFHSKGAPPSVQILSPAPATRAMNDAPLSLSGQAYDDAQRRIPGRRLRWFDGRRAIGRGGQIAVSGLAAGRRRLRLVARDARGRTRTASVTVRLRAAQPTFLRLLAPRRVSRTARLLRLRVASSIPATLRVGRQRFAVGRRMRSIRLRIRRGRSPLALRPILRAGGKRAVRTVVIARR